MLVAKNWGNARRTNSGSRETLRSKKVNANRNNAPRKRRSNKKRIIKPLKDCMFFNQSQWERRNRPSNLFSTASLKLPIFKKDGDNLSARWPTVVKKFLHKFTPKWHGLRVVLFDFSMPFMPDWNNWAWMSVLQDTERQFKLQLGLRWRENIRFQQRR